MIDEKNCYFFGRNKDTVDFVTDHASCSRVHAALVWHKHLNRTFIIDLGSGEHPAFLTQIPLKQKDQRFKFSYCYVKPMVHLLGLLSWMLISPSRCSLTVSSSLALPLARTLSGSDLRLTSTFRPC